MHDARVNQAAVSSYVPSDDEINNLRNWFITVLMRSCPDRIAHKMPCDGCMANLEMLIGAAYAGNESSKQLSAAKAEIAALQVPNWTANKHNWECTYPTHDFVDSELNDCDDLSEIIEAVNFHELPPTWWAYVPTTLDDAGDMDDGEWREFTDEATAHGACAAAFATLRETAASQ